MYQPRTNRRIPRPIGFNATPMIDVIFLLTVFFMLVSTFARKENVPLELPKPLASQAKDVDLPDRIVINCRLGEASTYAAGVALYSIGPNAPEPLDIIGRRLASMKQQSPDVKVIIRADRRLDYRDVRDVMRVVAANNIKMLNVAAHVGEGE